MAIDENLLADVRRSVGEKLKAWESRIQVSMHYKPTVKREEGERWEENGKTWVMKGGVPQTESVTQGARMPWWCPRCSNPMNHRFDRKFYYLRGWCFNCNVEVEHKMRVEGTWDAYEKQLTRANEVAILKDKIQQHLSYIKEFKPPTVYFENGGYEVLAERKVFEPLFEELMKDVEFCLNRLEQIKQEEENEQLAESS